MALQPPDVDVVRERLSTHPLRRAFRERRGIKAILAEDEAMQKADGDVAEEEHPVEVTA